ncbi:Imm26 family immunity protein [Roseateles sp. BYS96W]|uniref:Imm26 family immunity protein n=1 Tax=Pelomonas nitida TaxID=3299027 RepID=A0ABW7G3P7_9BURK
MKKQQRVVGAVLAVPLGDETTCYAITLHEADFAFFEARTSDASPPDDLLERPAPFRVAVHKSAWSNGRWLRVAKVELPEQFRRSEPKFMQDALNPGQFQIYVGGEIRPASRAECEGLERAAVWDPEHVESRLRDHYAGVPNQWLESLRLK